MLINDLSARTEKSVSEIQSVVKQLIKSGWFVLGPKVKQFEQAFANYIGVSHCIGVANGTDAIELALKAFGVGQGDRVLTVSNAGMYTTTALSAIGAEPFYLDVDLTSRNVTLAEVNRGIETGVKAVVVTHLYGLAVPEISEIATLCKSKNVSLLEDCAQAHGAKIGSHRVGTFGDAASFSFYPTKNLGALGDGGAVLTNNSDIAKRVSSLRQYGWTLKYTVEVAGARNSRLDEIQAAILSVFLPDLDAANARRRDIASKYSRGIHHPKVIVPTIHDEEFVAHLYVIRAKGRDALREHLRTNNIATDVHYPIPDYRQPIFGDRYAGLYLPNTEQLSKEIMTLPCYPAMSDADVDEVISRINAW